MGLLSDFFVADANQLERLDIHRGPAGTLPTVQARRVDPVKLITLQSAIEGTALNELIGTLDSLFVKGGEEGP